MDPFTIALATFGVQKLRGKSTNRSLRDALGLAALTQGAGMMNVPGFSAFGQTGQALAGNTLKQQFMNTGAAKGVASFMGGQTLSPGDTGGPGGAKDAGMLQRFMPKTTAGKVGLAAF